MKRRDAVMYNDLTLTPFRSRCDWQSLLLDVNCGVVKMCERHYHTSFSGCIVSQSNSYLAALTCIRFLSTRRTQCTSGTDKRDMCLPRSSGCLSPCPRLAATASPQDNAEGCNFPTARGSWHWMRCQESTKFFSFPRALVRRRWRRNVNGWLLAHSY